MLRTKLASSLALVTSVSLAALGCAGAPPPAPKCAETQPPAVAKSSSKAGAEPRERPAFAVLLRPMPEPLRVEVRIESTIEGLRTFTIARAAESDVADLDLRDLRGRVPTTLEARGAGLAIVPGREIVPPLALAYSISPERDGFVAPLARGVDVDAMVVSGESTIAVPEVVDAERVRVVVDVDAKAIAAGGVASTLGTGAHFEAMLAGRELRKQTFLAGELGFADFHAGSDGDDSLAWIGVATFDPRQASAEIASVRTALRGFFRSQEPDGFHVLLLARKPTPTPFATAPRARGLVAAIDPHQSWNAPLRIAVAHQLVHSWIGGQLWVGPADPDHETEAAWFTEGVCRYYAATLLWRLRALAADEYRAEMEGAMGVTLHSAHAALDNKGLAALATNDPKAMKLLTARGELWALRVDALVRAQSKGKRGLDDLVLAQLDRARKDRAPLPFSTLRDAVLHELGSREAAELDRAIVRGGAPDVPDDALGPCFRASSGPYPQFDVGFDAPRLPVPAGATVSGVRAGSPAEKAGLVAGEKLLSLVYEDGRSDVEVIATVERAGKPKTIRYLPARDAKPGKRWARDKSRAEASCLP